MKKSASHSIIYENINKYYDDKQILHSINLEINEGEFIAFVGPSGSGKSTLLRILAGLEDVTSGKIIIDGQDVTHLPPKDRDLAMVFQNYALYPHMTVRENILLGMKIRKLPQKQQTEAIERVAPMLQLTDLLDRKPRQLSGGQRQRVAMARAIVRNPKAFLMDEPLSNLDAKLRNEVRASIIEQQKLLGTTTIYVTHDQIEAMTMAHRIVVLEKGKIHQVGSPEELYHYPSNTFVAGFIGNPGMNFIQAEIKEQEIISTSGFKFSIPINSPIIKQNKIIIGLRPEHFHLQMNGDKNLNSIDCVVKRREMLGSEYLLHVQLQDNESLIIRIPNQKNVPEVNQSMTFYYSLEDIRLFCSNSLNLIYPFNSFNRG
ncbi:ABC transporter ATP-binding protein [Thorsellia anophelis]|uniref:sn-glycerol 3-phosphate transport system ATP-binding protein n=1 Tax=Thorsellia anophelis DSM 18579 TaxID=1123402 RepID=A0A1H9YNV5_9GAMM|nr:ABC transporter ATP-binding protein [Thorsellia anophelis]SES70760.1 sn-glycerol 3-phosphate transport system ATP-binding protein [Thorsellia anophelis DSM 18579]